MRVSNLFARRCLQRQRGDQIARVHPIERGVDGNVVFAGVRDDQRELRATSVGLGQAPIINARFGRSR